MNVRTGCGLRLNHIRWPVPGSDDTKLYEPYGVREAGWILQSDQLGSTVYVSITRLSFPTLHSELASLHNRTQSWLSQKS